MTKAVPRQRIEAELGVRAALEHDADAVHAGLAALGFFEPDDPRFDRERVLDHVRALNAWYANDEPVRLTPEYVSALLADAGDPRSEYWDLMKNETMPPDALFASRMQAMTLAAVCQLSATANWHRVMSEWLYGAAATSPPWPGRGRVLWTSQGGGINHEPSLRMGRRPDSRPQPVQLHLRSSLDPDHRTRVRLESRQLASSVSLSSATLTVSFLPRRRPGKHPETAHEREDRRHHHAWLGGENREVEGRARRRGPARGPDNQTDP